jgi:hypothetical protein
MGGCICWIMVHKKNENRRASYRACDLDELNELNTGPSKMAYQGWLILDSV